jgi:tRNA G18 (ribose-2'-O)-methylase SpoU
VDKEIVNISDMILKIPMLGKGASLNVASAVAIATYKFREFTL